MMDKYMKYKYANWNVSKYFRNLSAKPKICLMKSRTKDTPKYSSAEHEAASKNFGSKRNSPD